MAGYIMHRAIFLFRSLPVGDIIAGCYSKNVFNFVGLIIISGIWRKNAITMIFFYTTRETLLAILNFTFKIQ